MKMRHRHIALQGAAEGRIRQTFPGEEVMGFPDTLSVGPLADIGRPVALYRRMLWLRDFLRCTGGTDDTAERCDRMASLLSALPELGQVTLWAGDHPDEQLMLYALAPFLPVNATVISVSRHLRIAGTGSATPAVLRMLEHQGTPLDTRWRENLAEVWQGLQRNNATLHVSHKGHVQASGESELDETICQVLVRAVNSEPYIMDAVMAASGMQVNRDWLTWRIRFLQARAN